MNSPGSFKQDWVFFDSKHLSTFYLHKLFISADGLQVVVLAPSSAYCLPVLKAR